LRADAVSGLTVAVVALPLSMAIAIASGVSPERGLYTAIFGGLIISLIGGSRFQIGGPAARLLVLDFKDVPLIDTTAARSLVTFVNKVGRLGTSVAFAAARPTVRRTLNRAGLKPPLVRYSATAREAATMAPQ
jgi:SulP family sulfate permease